MKVKTPQPKAVEEDPAVKAQRLASEKAATDAADANVSDVLQRKTRLKARVFGLGSGSNAASGSGGGTSSGGAASFASPGVGADGRAYSFTGFNVGSIWKGGMF